jgi:hypothetical protein
VVSKQYVVRLSREERQELAAMVRSRRAAAHRVFWARILLKVDEGANGPHLTDAQVAEALETSTRTVERLRRRCVEEGLESALAYKRRATQSPPHVLDVLSEAQLLELCCSAPPPGHERWSLRLLASRLVQSGVVATISRETVRRTLRKRNAGDLIGSKVGDSSRTMPRSQ